MDTNHKFKVGDRARPHYEFARVTQVKPQLGKPDKVWLEGWTFAYTADKLELEGALISCEVPRYKLGEDRCFHEDLDGPWVCYGDHECAVRRLNDAMKLKDTSLDGLFSTLNETEKELKEAELAAKALEDIHKVLGLPRGRKVYPFIVMGTVKSLLDSEGRLRSKSEETQVKLNQAQARIEELETEKDQEFESQVLEVEVDGPEELSEKVREVEESELERVRGKLLRMQRDWKACKLELEKVSEVSRERFEYICQIREVLAPGSDLKVPLYKIAEKNVFDLMYASRDLKQAEADRDSYRGLFEELQSKQKNASPEAKTQGLEPDFKKELEKAQAAVNQHKATIKELRAAGELAAKDMVKRDKELGQWENLFGIPMTYAQAALHLSRSTANVVGPSSAPDLEGGEA